MIPYRIVWHVAQFEIRKTYPQLNYKKPDNRMDGIHTNLLSSGFFYIYPVELQTHFCFLQYSKRSTTTLPVHFKPTDTFEVSVSPHLHQLSIPQSTDILGLQVQPHINRLPKWRYHLIPSSKHLPHRCLHRV